MKILFHASNWVTYYYVLVVVLQFINRPFQGLGSLLQTLQDVWVEVGL